MLLRHELLARHYVEQVEHVLVQHVPGADLLLDSRKIYLGPLRVPMREITQTGGNPPIYVYDTSGPYTDPDARIDIRHGLLPLRSRWIEARGDSVQLDGPTSEYGR